jgi:NAD+ synthase
VNASRGSVEGLSSAALTIDCERVSTQIVDRLMNLVRRDLGRRGTVVALSGGIDSSVTAALCIRAFGPTRSLALLMPEADSSDDTLRLSRTVAEALGIETVHQDITPILEAAGCYRQRT